MANKLSRHRNDNQKRRDGSSKLFCARAPQTGVHCPHQWRTGAVVCCHCGEALKAEWEHGEYLYPDEEVEQEPKWDFDDLLIGVTDDS